GKSGGGDGRGPWGGGSSGGGQPPDLEELLKRSQDRLRKVIPTNFGGFGGLGGRGGIIVGVIIVGVWVFSGVCQVDPNEQGVVLRFGQAIGHTGPGLNYHLPWPIESVEIVNITGRRQVNIGYVEDRDEGNREVLDESLMLTGDENIVDINFSVIWLV